MVDFGAAFGGLAQGLAKGFQTGVEISQNDRKLAQQEELVKIQKAEFNVKAVNQIKEITENLTPEEKTRWIPLLVKQYEKDGVYINPVFANFLATASNSRISDYWKGIAKLAKAGKLDMASVIEHGEKTGMATEKGVAHIKEALSMSNQQEQLKISRSNAGAAWENIKIRKEELAEARRERAAAAVNTQEERLKDNASKTLTGPGQVLFEKQLAEDRDYQKARASNDSRGMAAAASKIRQSMSPEYYALKGTTDFGTMQEKAAQLEEVVRADPTNVRAKEELDTLRRQIKFGPKGIPEAHVKFTTDASMVKTGIVDLANIVADPKNANVANFKNRADVNQAVANLVVAQKSFLEMGANFTEMERKLVMDAIGGNPNDILTRMVRDREDFTKKLETAFRVIDRRIAAREKAITQGTSDDTTRFPESKKLNIVPAPR